MDRQFQKATLEKYADLVRDSIKKQIKEKKLYATGNLYRSVSEHLFESTNELGFDIKSAKYFTQVDEGRKKGRFVSNSKIKQWLLAKNITSELYPSKSIDEFAALISKTIKEKGTIKRFGYKGAGILDEIIGNFSSDFFDEMIESFADDMDLTVAELLKDVQIIKTTI